MDELETNVETKPRNQRWKETNRALRTITVTMVTLAIVIVIVTAIETSVQENTIRQARERLEQAQKDMGAQIQHLAGYLRLKEEEGETRIAEEKNWTAEERRKEMAKIMEGLLETRARSEKDIQEVKSLILREADQTREGERKMTEQITELGTQLEKNLSKIQSQEKNILQEIQTTNKQWMEMIHEAKEKAQGIAQKVEEVTKEMLEAILKKREQLIQKEREERETWWKELEEMKDSIDELTQTIQEMWNRTTIER
jgi:predicted PurR-regulated permease PerM